MICFDNQSYSNNLIYIMGDLQGMVFKAHTGKVQVPMGASKGEDLSSVTVSYCFFPS